MMQKFIIQGRLPGINELLCGANRHWAIGAALKREAMLQVQSAIKAARLKPVAGTAHLTVACFEPNARRDVDNVMGGANKIILDALQKSGILAGDGRKYVKTVVHAAVQVDRINPRVTVEIEEESSSEIV